MIRQMPLDFRSTVQARRFTPGRLKVFWLISFFACTFDLIIRANIQSDQLALVYSEQKQMYSPLAPMSLEATAHAQWPGTEASANVSAVFNLDNADSPVAVKSAVFNLETADSPVATVFNVDTAGSAVAVKPNGRQPRARAQARAQAYSQRNPPPMRTISKRAYGKIMGEQFRQQSERVALNQQSERDAFRQQGERDSLGQQSERGAFRQQGERDALRQQSERDALRQQSERNALRQQSERDAFRQQSERNASTQRQGERGDARRQQSECNAQIRRLLKEQVSDLETRYFLRAIRDIVQTCPTLGRYCLAQTEIVVRQLLLREICVGAPFSGR